MGTVHYMPWVRPPIAARPARKQRRALRATLRNMLRYPRCRIDCAHCGESYSSNASDYFWLGADALECCGVPCRLHRRRA